MALVQYLSSRAAVGEMHSHECSIGGERRLDALVTIPVLNSEQQSSVFPTGMANALDVATGLGLLISFPSKQEAASPFKFHLRFRPFRSKLRQMALSIDHLL